LIAIGNLLVPTVARVAGQYGRRATIRFSVRYGLVGGALIFLYYGFLAAFPATALRMVFKSHSPYIAMAGPLRWYQIDLAAIYIESVLMAWLYGLGESRTNFTSQMVKASFILLVALPATAMFGLYGLIAGNLIAVSLCIAVQLYFLRKALRHQSAAESERVREFAGLLPALD
jgi:O-antigen/teichoic acid export membrane protein